MIIPFLADNIDNQVIKGYKKGVTKIRVIKAKFAETNPLRLPVRDGPASAREPCRLCQALSFCEGRLFLFPRERDRHCVPTSYRIF